MAKHLICLYGGPGSGKSCCAAGLYHELKKQDKDVELCREFVKDWVWEKRPILQGDHIYFFGEQMRRELTLLREVDIVITDSPLLLTIEYEKAYCKSPYVMPILADKYNSILEEMNVTVHHFFLHRTKAYNPKGRNETEDQAEALDRAIYATLCNRGVDPIELVCDAYIVNNILMELEV